MIRGGLLPILAALLAIAAPAAAQKRIALSFDDVPRGPGAFMTPQQRTDRLIAALRRARVPQVAFFLNPGNLQQSWGAGREGQIRAYVRAGHVIANHSYSHPHLSEVGATAFVANIDQAAAWLRGRTGFRPWFRYPFLDEASRDVPTRDAVRAALRERHLQNGYVTVDGMDWLIDQRVTDAHQAGQAIDMHALRDLYVRTVVEAAEFSDQVARDALHRQPVQVILMHETDLEALFVADAVAALRAHGWQIVPIDEAYRDPIATAEPDSPFLSSRIVALATLPGMPPRDLTPPLNHMDVLNAAFDAEVLHRPPTPAAQRHDLGHAPRGNVAIRHDAVGWTCHAAPNDSRDAGGPDRRRHLRRESLGRASYRRAGNEQSNGKWRAAVLFRRPRQQVVVPLFGPPDADAQQHAGIRPSRCRVQTPY